MGGASSVFAEALPTSPVTVTKADKNYSGTGDATISSKNVETLPPYGTNTGHSGILKAGGEKGGETSAAGEIKVSGYDSLNVYNQTVGNTGYANAIFTGSGSSIDIENVGTVNVTNDTQELEGNTVAVHVYGGTFTVKDVDYLNITAGNSGAIMVQQTAGTESGHANIDVNKDIHISGGSVTAAIYADGADPTQNQSELIMHAGGNISIDQNVRIQNNWVKLDGTQGDAFGGNSSLSVSGDKGVHIGGQVQITGQEIKDNTYSKGDYQISVTSKDGDVTIDKGVYLQSKQDTAHVQANISGNNVILGNGSSFGTIDRATLVLGAESGSDNVYLNGTGSILNGGKIDIADHTTTYVDSKYLTQDGKYFINTDTNSTGDEVTLGKSSQFVITNADTNSTFNFSNTEPLARKLLENVKTDNLLQTLREDTDKSTGKYVVDVVSKEKAAELLSGSIIPTVAWKGTEENYDPVKNLIGKDAATAVKNLNTLGNLGELAGFSHSTYTASNLFTNTIGTHLDVLPNKKDLWGYYVHNKESVDGLGLAGGIAANYDATYDGAVVGMDLYQSGNTTAGAAISYINGSISGAGVKNDADYYGLSFYGRKDLANYSLIGDVSYLHGSNDITATIAGETFAAKPDADAFSLGVKAVKDIQLTENSKLTPYVGARYLRINTESYNAGSLHYDADSQDLLIVPVGVDYSADFQKGAWTYHPIVGVGYVWNAAGRSVDQTVSLDGAADTFGYNTVDKGSFIAKVGLTAEKENLSFGVGYEYQNGDSTSADKWTVSAAYRF